jgi:hypothetical protein
MDMVDVIIWMDGRPAWQRHMLIGALIVVVARGAWIALPILAVILVIAKGMAGLVLFGKILLAVVIAMLGGALAGGAYTLVGRHLQRVRFIGPWLAGVTSVWPYIAVIMGILWWFEPGKLASSWRLDGIVFVAMAGWAGLLIGYAFLSND